MTDDNTVRGSSRERAEKERGLLEQDYAFPCQDCGAVVFDWWDGCQECSDETARFECPECNEEYDQHVSRDGQQGCCPNCGEKVRGSTLRPGQGQLDRWSA